ncbi:hypothetical protein Bca52824_033740 [Brassica carinata]|uniref:Uncharacterized protein n=1 Tax=Brassica carinata TaxID=52824 RepID=A0A8X7SDG7_BRACI|nr:hypothetical protein Bca52824_033740 [Brassica carinata]
MAGSVFLDDAETPMSQESSTKRRGGGWITFPFMFATLLGLTIAAWGWLLNLIVYLIQEFNVKSIVRASLMLGVPFTAITLAAIGVGGTRFTLATAGANQFDKTKDQGSFFNGFFFTTYLAGAISATAIVYSEDNISWTLGFGLCAAANLFSFLVFIFGKRLYKHDKPLGNPFTSILGVILAAVLKRKAEVSASEKDYYN